MLNTGSENFKSSYLILAIIIILIVIATIFYFVFFRKEDDSEFFDTTHTTEEKPGDNRKLDKASLQRSDHSDLSDRVIKAMDSIANFPNLDKSINNKLSKALKNFRETELVRKFESLLNEEHQQIQARENRKTRKTSEMVFERTMKEIQAKYNTLNTFWVRQRNFEFLNQNFINEIFKDGNIKSSINLENIEDAKNPLFKNIPLLILVDLEFGLIEIKQDIFRFYVETMDEYVKNVILLISEHEKLRGTKNYKKVKEALEAIKMYGRVEFSLEKYNELQETVLMRKEENSKHNTEVLAKLNNLKNFLIEESNIN